MLYELYVENFALIRQLRLNLTDGMTALTGETGAGKSLIVDAVSLLIGGRGSDSFIRSGQDRCLIEGVFLPPFPPGVAAALEEQELDPEDNLVLSRELIRGGRSLARVNGRVASVSRLRELGRLLINIHGQHEYTLLLEEERQLHLLDSFGGPELAQALAETEQAYRGLVRAKRKLTAYVQQRDQRKARMEQLAYALEEIDAVNPEPGEDQRLEAESRVLSHGEKLYAISSDVYEQLRGSSGAVDSLDAAYGALRHGAELDPALAELLERLHSLYYEADDVAGELAAYRDRISTDAYRLDQVESRIASLNRLKKKHGGSLEGVLEARDRDRREYAELEEIDLSGELYQSQMNAAKEAYVAASGVLTRCREAAAAALGEAITRELQGMCMENALFFVDLPRHNPTAQGNEQAVFMIRPNLGEAAQPVSKIASGGELSRILLGIKVILSGLDGVPVLIFDEIDTGLSGRALVAVAERLALVGKNAQTLAVSHAPVMAAAADNQILIEKHEEDGRTVMAAHPLDREERIAEIARMIAGSIVTPASHQQAQDLLNQMHPS